MLPKSKWSGRSSSPTGSRSARWRQRGTRASTTPTGQGCFPPWAHLTQASWKEKKRVPFPKFCDDSGILRAVLFTKFYFAFTSCSKRDIYVIEKLLQLFVILWVWISYQNRHSDVLGHLLFSPSKLRHAFGSTLSEYVTVLKKKKDFLVLFLQICSLVF